MISDPPAPPSVDTSASPAEAEAAQIAAAERALLTVAGRRQAAEELTVLLTGMGVAAEQASNLMEGQGGSNSPRKHAAAHTARFFLDTALRRDIAGMSQLLSYPFRFEDQLCHDLETIERVWLKRVAAEGPPLTKAASYKPLYQTVMLISEFRSIDPMELGKLLGMNLAEDDFVVGMVIAYGTIAEPVNYLLRWNGGTLRLAGIWT